MNISAKWRNSEKIDRIISEIAKTADPAFQRRVMRVIGGVYLKETEDRFLSQRDPSRKKWAPLSKRTIANKKRRGALMGPAHIGVDKGPLGSSIQLKIEGREATLGSDVEYAKDFHYKTKFSPARRIFGRDPRADKKVLDALNKFFRVTFLK